MCGPLVGWAAPRRATVVPAVMAARVAPAAMVAAVAPAGAAAIPRTVPAGLAGAVATVATAVPAQAAAATATRAAMAATAATVIPRAAAVRQAPTAARFPSSTNSHSRRPASPVAEAGPAANRRGGRLAGLRASSASSGTRTGAIDLRARSFGPRSRSRPGPASGPRSCQTPAGGRSIESADVHSANSFGAVVGEGGPTWRTR